MFLGFFWGFCGSWWFLVVLGGFWWFLVVLGVFWLILVVFFVLGGSWWFLVVFNGSWWFLMVCFPLDRETHSITIAL
jgi:hypothetical protein